MDIHELYLLTAFACMACDGEIAKEEIELIKSFAASFNLFSTINVENKLNEYVSNINDKGNAFLNEYLTLLKNANLSSTEQLNIIEIAIKMIEADNIIQYSEIAFFKKIRAKLSISDAEILKVWSVLEDYLLPDTKVDKFNIQWESIKFEDIQLGYSKQ